MNIPSEQELANRLRALARIGCLAIEEYGRTRDFDECPKDDGINERYCRGAMVAAQETLREAIGEFIAEDAK